VVTQLTGSPLDVATAHFEMARIAS
jgi:hypothetical protein